MEYKHNAHAVCDLRCHVIWCAKYRYKISRASSGAGARPDPADLRKPGRIYRKRCSDIGPRPSAAGGASDPVTVRGKLAQYIKGRLSRHLQAEFPDLTKRYWGQRMWARGYFCATVSAVDEATIKAYIESQEWDEDDQDFTITSAHRALSRFSAGRCLVRGG